MKIKFFGTAAAEGIPAFFCSCDVCEKSRLAGGRNVRTRSQTIINDDLLIDFSADTYTHIVNGGLDLRPVKSLLITHGHDDHLYPYDLVYRTSPVYAKFPNKGKDKEPLQIYLTKNSGKLLRKVFRQEKVMLRDKKAVNVNYIEKFIPFETNGYYVTPLKADHTKSLDPVIYMISKDGKNILYAHDTGFFPKKTWEYIENTNIKFNFVTLDCTCAIDKKAYGHHMGYKACKDVKDRLIKSGHADEKTIFCINHFSHNCGYTYDELCEVTKDDGFFVSFDGLEIEF